MHLTVTLLYNAAVELRIVRPQYKLNPAIHAPPIPLFSAPPVPLFSDPSVNVSIGDPEERIMMVTGRHIVADISCVGCGSHLGWKYVTAFEQSQKYKEKRFLLDRYMLLGPFGVPIR